MSVLLWTMLLGCQKLGSVGDALKTRQPTISYKRLKTDNIDFSGIDATLVFQIDNPNPVQIALASVDYALQIEGEEVLTGAKDDGLTLAASDTTNLKVPLSLTFDGISSLLDATRGKDELGFGVSGDMGFNTPIGELKLPYNAEGSFPVLRAPKVSLKKLRVEELAVLKDSASLALDLDVTNRGGAAISFKDIDYKLSLAGASVASGKLAQLGSIEGSETETVSVPIDITLTGLGQAVITALTDRSALNTAFSADLSVETPFGDIPLSLDESSRLQLQ